MRTTGWVCVLGLMVGLVDINVHADGLLERFKARKESREAANAGVDEGIVSEIYKGREMLVHVPPSLPAQGTRALVVVLHGGMGNAGHIHSLLGMDAIADKDGFVVAYLNGEPAAKRLSERRKAWNAGGGCCGQPFETNVDDVTYIEDAVGYLREKYGIAASKVYGIGHSNGAMMTQRMMCESDVYAAAVPISGPLQLDVNMCPAATGKRLFAIHGAADENVPVAGGVGTKGISKVDFRSQEVSRHVFEASGSSYELHLVPGADHSLATVDKKLQAETGRGLADTAARFFEIEK